MDVADAEAMARDLMSLHGLRRWNFTFDRATRRFGCCRFGPRSISLSRHLTQLNDPEAVRQTILHEIAHALAGPRAGHGPKWRKIALSIGATPRRCYDGGVNQPPPRYVATCHHCSGAYHRMRRPVDRRYCGICFRRGFRTPLVWTTLSNPATGAAALGVNALLDSE
jgi:predicted SprT family Zn-dependent metalloprotease